MTQAVILAGGLGTRLRPVLSDRPKALAMVGHRPFLEWLILALSTKGIRRIVLATGYLGDAIEGALGDGGRWGVTLEYSHESEPAGTGGALRLAAGHARDNPVLVLNGDSYCRFDLARMLAAHSDRGAAATIWLQPSDDAARFGTVELQDGQVTRFLEKGRAGEGLISCGVYLIDQSVIKTIPPGPPVSLEQEVFPRLAGAGLYGVVGSGTFLDIGTPEALAKADRVLQEEFRALQRESQRLQHGREYLDRSLAVQRQSHAAALEALMRAADAVVASFRQGGRLLLCGNGGSAADCQHIATELVCRLSKELDRPAMPALALTTDTSILTAYGNDVGFEAVFARQVEAHGRKGDVLIAISTSGNSPNVLRAVEAAKRQGLTTIALTGAGGKLEGHVDIAVVVPDRNTQHIQESLLPLEHLLCDVIETALHGTPA